MVIVGAGAAGIAAARKIVAAGRKFVLLEAADHVGGRCVTDLRTFVLGSALTPTHRAQLATWLQANTTGGPYIRAAVPSGWKVGDKTGNGGYGARNDIAVIWPPDNAAPIVIAVLTNRREDENATSNDALIADASKVALQALTGQA